MRFALFRNSVMPEHQLVEKNVNIAKRFIFGYYNFSEWAHYCLIRSNCSERPKTKKNTL